MLCCIVLCCVVLTRKGVGCHGAAREGHLNVVNIQMALWCGWDLSDSPCHLFVYIHGVVYTGAGLTSSHPLHRHTGHKQTTK